MVSAAWWWFLLGNGYHLRGACLGVALGACEMCICHPGILSLSGKWGMVERSAVLPVTFQPFALIFLCQVLRGHSLLFEAMGEMIEHSISYLIVFSKLNHCA